MTDTVQVPAAIFQELEKVVPPGAVPEEYRGRWWEGVVVAAARLVQDGRTDADRLLREIACAAGVTGHPASIAADTSARTSLDVLAARVLDQVTGLRELKDKARAADAAAAKALRLEVELGRVNRALQEERTEHVGALGRLKDLEAELARGEDYEAEQRRAETTATLVRLLGPAELSPLEEDRTPDQLEWLLGERFRELTDRLREVADRYRVTDERRVDLETERAAIDQELDDVAAPAAVTRIERVRALGRERDAALRYYGAAVERIHELARAVGLEKAGIGVSGSDHTLATAVLAEIERLRAQTFSIDGARVPTGIAPLDEFAQRVATALGFSTVACVDLDATIRTVRETVAERNHLRAKRASAERERDEARREGVRELGAATRHLSVQRERDDAQAALRSVDALLQELGFQGRSTREERIRMLAERHLEDLRRIARAAGLEKEVDLGSDHVRVIGRAILTRAEARERQVAELAREVEQLRVQLAGCGAAALGATAPDQVAQPDDYGWSPAYRDVLELRGKYETLLGTVRDTIPAPAADEQPAVLDEALELLRRTREALAGALYGGDVRADLPPTDALAQAAAHRLRELGGQVAQAVRWRDRYSRLVESHNTAAQGLYRIADSLGAPIPRTVTSLLDGVRILETAARARSAAPSRPLELLALWDRETRRDEEDDGISTFEAESGLQNLRDLRAHRLVLRTLIEALGGDTGAIKQGATRELLRALEEDWRRVVTPAAPRPLDPRLPSVIRDAIRLLDAVAHGMADPGRWPARTDLFASWEARARVRIDDALDAIRREEQDEDTIPDLIEGLAVLEASTDPAGEVRRCRRCHCTDDDCRGCIARTGAACSWVADDLCSACVDDPDPDDDPDGPIPYRPKDPPPTGEFDAPGEDVRRAVAAVLHQIEHGEAAEGDARDLAWCADQLRKVLATPEAFAAAGLGAIAEVGGPDQLQEAGVEFIPGGRAPRDLSAGLAAIESRLAGGVRDLLHRSRGAPVDAPTPASDPTSPER